jgi:undecaprenyl-diphosphatase
MAGAGALKAVKFFLSGEVLSGEEILILVAATLTAFAVSLAVIRFLLDFVRRHSFAPFGVYRILLGAVVLLVYFL